MRVCRSIKESEGNEDFRNNEKTKMTLNLDSCQHIIMSNFNFSASYSYLYLELFSKGVFGRSEIEEQ